ncbi:hypothetical protein ACQCSX_21695 (plasmid) [Pseudarthrobacter sp. P1]
METSAFRLPVRRSIHAMARVMSGGLVGKVAISVIWPVAKDRMA